MHPLSVGGMGGAGVEPPTKFSKRGGLAGPPFLDGSCWERGVTFSRERGVCNFSTKNKLKSGMFNDKKVYKQERFALL